MKEHILSLMDKYLQVPYQQRGAYIVCKCPFHKDGNEAHASFGINVEEGFFNCYSCHRSGSLARLLGLLGADRKTIDEELEDIAEDLERLKKVNNVLSKNFFSGNDPFKAEYVLPEVILGVYDWEPTTLIQKGFDPVLLKDMEVGFDKASNRVTYPLRDMYGNLAGISGGSIIPNYHPKYKVYQGGKTIGSRWAVGDFGDWFDSAHPNYKCMNHNFLWNYDRVFPRIIESPKEEFIYVVEGFKACLWMIQAGFKNTVAAMGSYLSEQQQRLLHRFGGTIVLCFDNDEAGRKASVQVGKLLWEPFYGRVKILQYPTDHNKTQPDDYPPAQLRQMVQEAKQFIYPNDPLRRQSKFLLGE